MPFRAELERKPKPNSQLQRSFWRIRIESILAMLPLAIACVPWGILTGALSIQVGLSPLQSQLLSALVFAGAAQLSALTMFAAHATGLSILGSTVVISSRHILYSLTFKRHVEGLSLPRRLLISFVLTDEMFAVSEADTRRHKRFSSTYALWSGFTFYVLWNISTALGIFAADRLDNLDSLGLEFAIAATFIAMTFDRIRELPILITIGVAAASVLLLKPLTGDATILVSALIGMLAGYCSDSGAPRDGDRP